MEKIIFKKFVKDISLFFILIISVVLLLCGLYRLLILDLISEDGHSLKFIFHILFIHYLK